jgi:uncharacterized membrane protein YedE/YeeE
MRTKLVGLLFGVLFGFVMAWAHLSDPKVIREMLLLQSAHVFLFMGSAVAVAALGQWILSRSNAGSLLSGEPIAWSLERPERRHIVGSVIFGAGWSVAGTCPGPVAAMIGEGRLASVFVALGLVGGVLIQGVVKNSTTTPRRVPIEAPGVVGL